MYMFAEPMEEDKIEDIQKGERGTLEEFMGRLKEKLQSVHNGVDEGEEVESGEAVSQLSVDEDKVDCTEVDLSDFEKQEENEIDDEEVDEKFLDELQAQAAKDEAGNLFGVTLTINNIVNGEEVLRPNLLKEGDVWEVGYSIAEFKCKSRTSAVYNAMRLRKQRAHHTRLSSADPEQLGGYQQYIRSLSSQGREWEKHQEALDAHRKTVVYEPKST
jgi:hypothetical protein